MRCVILSLTAFALGALPLQGADLIEPWERGFSDLELYVAGARGEGRGAVSVLGFGLPGAISLGLTASGDAEGTGRTGIVAFWSGSTGASWQVDAYAEAGTERSSDEGVSDWLVGTEWSYHRHAAVPYLRLTHLSSSEAFTEALAGVVVPAGSRVELHLELAGPVAGSAGPSRLVLGPNVSLAPGVELLTEVSLLRIPAGEPDAWAASLGLVLDPRRLRRSRGPGG